MIRQDIQWERKHSNTLLIVAYRYNKMLDRELATLAEQEEYFQSTEEVLRKQWEQNREKKFLIKQKRAAAIVSLLNSRALSTSARLTTKPTPISFANTLTSRFCLIK